MIKEDQHITVRNIEATLKIDVKVINNILHKHLKVCKLCFWWIPHSLTLAQQEDGADLHYIALIVDRLIWCTALSQVMKHGYTATIPKNATIVSWVFENKINILYLLIKYFYLFSIVTQKRNIIYYRQLKDSKLYTKYNHSSLISY
ncbi:unnamed protein product [Psylliodes chrysocephalus]|uniref:Uncharacterized protein n=1 Tax=Psylliodes chrysocephalus TaxID=3402493 RepID=A0A9P0D4D5_9CUCU|nr:unnamed protein product [Psylliodes chrysocephala]